MTKEEITICRMYLDDLDKTHSCNEYLLLQGLLNEEEKKLNGLHIENPRGFQAHSISDPIKSFY